MLTRKRLGSIRWILFGGLMGGSLVVWAGCWALNASSVNSLLQQMIEQLNLETGSAAVTIRLVNQNEELTEELDVRIDGRLETLTCEADVGLCDLPLTELPTRVEAVEERRLDADGAYQGGRSFQGQPEFTLTEDEFQAGSIIVFQLSETTAKAFVL